MKDLKKKTVTGVIWSFLDKTGSQLVSFLITILLARLLEPKEFGLIAMATVFFAIARVFIESGLKDSLIQKKESSQIDYNTVFYFNLAVAVLIFLIVFFAAPAIADFYGYTELVPVIRVLAITIVIYSFSIVQTAVIVKAMRFKVLLKARMPAIIISGIAGLFLAWYGMGVWALVFQIISESLIINVLLWRFARWSPTWAFQRDVFRFHWKHGSRLLFIGIINSLYKNIFALIIGKFFSPTQLGFYNRADSFRVFILNNTVGLIQNVSYPALAQVQDNDVVLRNTYRKIIQVTLFVTLPASIILITQASPIIELLLTSKWLPASPILVVLATANIFSPFNSINLNVLKVKRRTDLLLRVELINKSILIAIVLVTVNFGFDYLVMTNLFIAIFALFINNYFTNKLIRYSLLEQFQDILPLAAAFLVSLTVSYFFRDYFTFDSLVLSIVLTVLVTVTSYLLVAFLIKRNIVISMFDILKLLK